MDKNKIFPSQLSDFDLYECTALAVCDLAGNILGKQFSNDFTYAATLQLEGVAPDVDPDGADPWTALQSAVAYGLLPLENATFTSKTKGELYSANWLNYTAEERSLALQHQMIAPINLGVNYDGMVTWMRMHQQGVMISLTWFSSFGTSGYAQTNQQGIMPTPSGSISNHCVAAYLDTDNTTVLIKPWLGTTWGRGGYGILTKELYDTIAKDTFSFDVSGNHWLAILAIICTKFPYLYDKLPVLTSAGTMNTQTANGQKLYDTAYSLIGKNLTADDVADGYGVYGCAESVNAVFTKAFGGPIGGGASTALMLRVLASDKRFEEILLADVLPGDVIIFGTGTSGIYPQAHGHVLIAGKTWCMSNNSENPGWTANYTYPGLKAYFIDAMGFPPRCFRVL